MRVIQILVAALVTTAAGFGQGAPARFEVASVKPFDEARDRLGMTVDDALVTINGFALGSLIVKAYNVDRTHIQGPDFLFRSRFNVSAKIPSGVSKDRVPEMLAELLKERFALVAHRETRTIKAYILTVQKPDLLAKSKSTEEEIQTVAQRPNLALAVHNTASGDREATFTAQPFSEVVKALRGLLGTEILDQTGISGAYTLVLDLPWGDATPYSGPPDPTSAFEALARHGLKLQAGQFAVEELIIDSVKKVPTEN